MSTPIRRIRSACCARAASGNAAAPPTMAINSRRLMVPSNRGLHPTTSLNERIVRRSKIVRSISGLGHNRRFATRLREARDEAAANRIGNHCKNNGDGARLLQQRRGGGGGL